MCYITLQPCHLLVHKLRQTHDVADSLVMDRGIRHKHYKVDPHQMVGETVATWRTPLQMAREIRHSTGYCLTAQAGKYKEKVLMTLQTLRLKTFDLCCCWTVHPAWEWFAMFTLHFQSTYPGNPSCRLNGGQCRAVGG